VKKQLAAFAIVLGWVSVAWGTAAPVTLTTLQAVRALSNAEADKALPVAIEATVTYIRAYEHTLFVQEGNQAIYVKIPEEVKVLPGDRVLVQGTTFASFHTDIQGEKITLLRHSTLPDPVPATFDELNHAKYDCILVSIHGVVRSADQVLSRVTPVVSSRLNILTDGGDIDAYVDSDDPDSLNSYLDTEVEVTGVVWGRFDGKYQLTGTNLYVSSLSSVKIIKRASTSPWALPVTPMDQIFSGYHVNELTQRTRVQGTITYYQPGSALVLQNGAKSLWIMTETHIPLLIGDQADATGFPGVHDGFLTLAHGEVQDRHVQALVQPQPMTWKQITSSRHIFDLISIEGVVVTAIREPSQDEYVLVSDGYMFSAVYRHPNTVDAHLLPPMTQIPLGSRVRITGICVMNTSSPFDRDVPFNILLRSFDDISVVAPPSLLSVRNLIILLSLMLLVVIAVGAWGWTLNTKVRRQSSTLTTMAQIEQRRSRILEDINGSKPLAEILEQTTGMISFMLDGAPCWCEVKGGARLGNYPLNAEELHILHEEIPARCGPAHGKIFAAFGPGTSTTIAKDKALTVGARLATLAMETRRLYSDLLHRSEFDLLTDIHNRFSLEKQTDALIEEARQGAGIFGLIYIDLDEFKQVNDLYSHHIGDLYLQEAARRMKHQLRSHDLLARLGGDEFAVLLPMVRNRAGLEEIAQRLEHCFCDPFVLEEHTLQGSASFGVALYPEDSVTRDGLLNTADAAMYAAKKKKRPHKEGTAENESSGLKIPERV